MKDLFYLAVGIAVIAGSFYFFLQNPASPKYQPQNTVSTIRVGAKTIKVDVADTPEERELGLSGRTTLPEGEGMLFIFDTPAQHGFWMKDMNFAIDIVWLDESWRVIRIDRGVTPETFPKIFTPSSPAKYVLELPTGYSKTLLLDIGSTVFFDH